MQTFMLLDVRYDSINYYIDSELYGKLYSL